MFTYLKYICLSYHSVFQSLAEKANDGDPKIRFSRDEIKNAESLLLRLYYKCLNYLIMVKV